MFEQIFLELKNWCENNNLQASFNEGPIFLIGEKKCLLLNLKYKKDVFFNVEEKEENDLVIFDSDFHLILSEEEESLSKLVDYYVYFFGDNFYFSKSGSEKNPELNLMKYLGESKEGTYPENMSLLGIHGKMEIMNGSREYSEWCKKAKFLKINSLAIIEKDTLAGSLQFQLACKDYNIKPILGETITIKLNSNSESFYGICYVINKEGWKNLLKINKFINVDNNGFILENDLLNLGKGLYFVFKYDSLKDKNKIYKYNNAFEKIFYQIDSVIWSNQITDLNYLQNIKTYLEEYQSLIEPILIDDCFYLESEEYKIKKILNKITPPSVKQNDSKHQHFKNLNEIKSNVKVMFDIEKEGENRFNLFFNKIIENNIFLSQTCNFKIELGKFHLPQFNTNHLDNSLYPKDTNDLFFFLLEKSLVEKGLINNEKYTERLDRELEVIYKGGFVDYFLTLWDIIRYCDEKNIVTGIGRGSAAGSLISYLLGITKIDPIKYGLLFERFLNEGRIGKSLPDIDTDFPVNKREEIKKYIESLYGSNYFCSIGAYVNLKIKSGIKDLARIYKINFNTVNILTSVLQLKEGKDGNFEEIFKSAVKMPLMYDFVCKNVKLINQLFYILKQPKAAKIHPCATIILPKYEGEDIFDYIPMRREDGTTDLIAEWEGTQLESAGFLKEDILGLEQLDKINFTLELIQKTINKKIDIYSINLDDPVVMSFFKKGNNSDVFQFGSPGLTKFCKQVLPDSLEELINMVALFRPGPIQSGAHFDYINIKFGKKSPEYDYGVEEIVKSTFGIYIFQEQVMKVMEVLGGFNPVETDDIRKAMGKKKESILASYKTQFIEGAKSRGCPDEEANNIWDKMLRFSAYGFNKSHAAAYALTGYISQWLKVYYPLQFWTSTLQFATDEKDILKYLAEIKRTSSLISIVPPDINRSTNTFESDYKTGKIYWSLEKIKFLGEIGLETIFEDRKKNGNFYSIEDFCSRIPKAKANKRIVINLILGGCFDEIYNLTSPLQRRKLIEEYCIYNKIDINQEVKILNDFESKNEWWWVLKQKEISKFGFIDYRNLIIKYFPGNAPYFVESFEIQSDENDDKNAVVGGVIKSVVRKKTNAGKGMAQLTIDSNNELVIVYIWPTELEKFDNLIVKESEGKIILLNAKIKWDSYRQCNSIYLDKFSNLKIL